MTWFFFSEGIFNRLHRNRATSSSIIFRWGMSDSFGGSSPFPFSDKENEKKPSIFQNAASVTKTPSKARLSLGAPASFYFKYVNSSKKTAAVAATSFLEESTLQDEDNLTGTISIPGLNNKFLDKADTSLLSLGASSSGSSSEGDGDLLNKSTLSDTTDLTASIFVLQATSRQVMRQMAASSAKKKCSKNPRNETLVHPLTKEGEVSPSNKGMETTHSVPDSTNKAPRSSSQLSTHVSQETSLEGTNAPRRESLRGTSPSLRQRMSATPQSLKKLTEELRNQRMKRQMKQDAMRRLSVDSKNSIQSLNAQLESLNRNESMDNATLDRRRLPPAFTLLTHNATEKDSSPVTKATLDSKNDPTCTTYEITGAKEELQHDDDLSQTKKEETIVCNNVETWDDNATTPGSIPRSIDIARQPSPDRQLESPFEGGLASDDQASCNSPSTPDTIAFAAMSSRRTQGPTPTKLKSTPRRITNPKSLHSPARHTRSSAKKGNRSTEAEEIAKSNQITGKSWNDDLSLPEKSTLMDAYDDNVDSPMRESTATRSDNEEQNNRNHDQHGINEFDDDEGEGDTASLGDLISVFGSQQKSQTEERDQSVDTDVSMTASNREEAETAQDDAIAVVHDSTMSEGESATMPSCRSAVASMETQTISEGESATIPSCRSAVASMETQTIYPKVGEIVVLEDRPGGLMNSKNASFMSRKMVDSPSNTSSSDMGGKYIDDFDQGASMASSTGSFTGHLSPSSLLITHEDTSDEKEIPIQNSSLIKSPSQSEGDTASLGDIAEVFGRRQGTSPTSSNTERVRDISSSTPLSIVNSFSCNSLGKTEEAKLMQSQKPFGSTDSCMPSKREHGNNSASNREVARRIQAVLSPGVLHSPSAAFVMDENGSIYTRIKTQLSQTSNETSILQTSQDSFGSAEKSSVGNEEGQDTASLSDIADFFGSAMSQNKGSSAYLSADRSHTIHLPDLALADSQASSSPRSIDESFKDTTTNTIPSASSFAARSSQSQFSTSASPSRKRSRSFLGATDAGPSSHNLSDLSPGAYNMTPNRNRTDTLSQIKLHSNSRIRLTPNFHKKPTPTKIAHSPKRVPNPHCVSSPAQSTRSRTKSDLPEEEEDEGSPVEWHHSGSKRRLPDVKANSVDEFESSNDLMYAQGFAFDLDVSDTRKKPRKSTIQSVSTAFCQKENTPQTSPLAKKIQPAGILSSRKKATNRSTLKSSHRSVAFGSPEAAEYHIESPSVNMTPMPPSKAKALFAIPRGTAAKEDFSISIEGGENTVEIEADLNVLIDKITVENMKESPQLSPILNARDNTGPVVLPGKYDRSNKSLSVSMPFSQTSSYEDTTIDEIGMEENTVELEGGMDRLIANMFSTSKTIPSCVAQARTQSSHAREAAVNFNLELSPAESSVEMTDAQSIASLNSAKTGKYTSKLQLDAQKLDFSFNQNDVIAMEGENNTLDTDGGNTVELENGMTGLLVAAGLRDVITETETSILPRIVDNAPSPEDIEDGQRVNLKGASEIVKCAATQGSNAESSVVSFSSNKTSMSRRRFTLNSDDRIGISFDGSIMAPESSCADEGSVSLKLETSEQEPSITLVEEPLTLTFDELLQSVAVTRAALKAKHQPKASDSIVAFNKTVKSASELASERWNQFLQAVCVEVERRTERGCEASDAMSTIFCSEPHRFIDLQRKLRCMDNIKLRDFMTRLVIESQKVVSFEWDTWLATVMESFSNPLNEVFSDLEANFNPWDEISLEYEQVQRNIGLVNVKKVQKARRKSLMRRKVSTCYFPVRLVLFIHIHTCFSPLRQNCTMRFESWKT